MRQFNPSSSRIKQVVFLACLFSVVAIVLSSRPAGAAKSSKSAAASIVSADPDRPIGAEGINLLVNDAGDASDTAVGDNICDTSPTAGNQCTLRAAIQETNNATGDDTINFNLPASTIISLNSGLPNISGTLAINGPGANQLTVERSAVSGTPNFRVFIVNSGSSVEFANLTLAKGSVVGTSPGNLGGNLFNQGTLTINNCTVKDAVAGGGIGNFSGSLTINGSTISGNNGNGVMNAVPQNIPTANPASVTINNSVISGNTGSGVYNNVVVGNALSPATVSINNSTISGNNINSSGSGAGIHNGVGTGGTATIVMNNSTISGNTNSAGGAGAIYNAAVFNGTASTIANVTIINSTVFGNTAGTGSFAAGGISNILSSCTGCDNTVTLHNTIVAGNFRDSGAIASDIPQTINPASSFNLIGVGGAGGLSNGVNSNQLGVANPKLAPLANNGGPTQTHALLAGSRALDAGDDSVTRAPLTLSTDQRGSGFLRQVDGPDANTTSTVDIGAFEAQVSVEDISDQTVKEDGQLQFTFNVGGSATVTSVTAASSNTSLIPNDVANIALSGSGSTRMLTINPVANQFGASTITVLVGNSNGQSMADTFWLTVHPINDAPSFTKGADQTVNENDGAQTVNNWATNISAGPANESGQSVTFVVSHDVDPSPFAAAPAISSAGTLTYTPAPGFSGTATITAALQDDGGTVNVGDVNTSVKQTFAIQVLDGGALALSTSTYSFNESVGSASITITRSGGSAGTATVLFATSDGTATAEDYSPVTQTVTFLQGEVSKTVNVNITNDLFKEPDETVNLTLSNAGGSGELGAQSTAVLTILDDDPIGGYLRFTSASFNTTEGSGSATISVERVGDLAEAVTVDYATSDSAGATTAPCSTTNSFASSRCDYTTSLGTLRFAPGEGAKTFAILISQDNYREGPEALGLTLSNLTGGAGFAAPSAATLTITDDATEPATNPIDNAESFVRQHYNDFLNREPDASGLAFWSNQITECQQPGASCNAEVRRINVSAAFFVSIEFQETGYLVYRMYKAGYGNIPGTPVPLTLIEFLPDTQRIGKDVIVGETGWPQKLEDNKVAYARAFVSRPRFTTAYPTTVTPEQFVDALFTNAGVVPSASDRTAAINEFGGAANTADTAARGRALRRVAGNATLAQQEFNRAFVLMQYFGYLRRNPNDAPEPELNFDGYNFWLSKLNEFNGNYIAAELVKAFISSGEYRQRFGQ